MFKIYFNPKWLSGEMSLPAVSANQSSNDVIQKKKNSKKIMDPGSVYMGIFRQYLSLIKNIISFYNKLFDEFQINKTTIKKISYFFDLFISLKYFLKWQIADNSLSKFFYF